MKKNHKAGFSLIEIMVSALLLAVLAVGGASVLYHTGAGVQVQGNKRIAMEYARSRIEASKLADYFVLRNQAPDDPVSVSTTVNGVALGITTDIILHGDDPDDPNGQFGRLGNEFLELEIQVQYGRSSDETVVMNTTRVLL